MKDIFDKIKVTCKELGLSWAVIGGGALPFYKVIRSTVDLDISIYFKSENELQMFLNNLSKRGVKTAQKPRLTDLAFVVFNSSIPDEAEIWLHPCDAFKWDEEIIKRINIIDDIPILSPEDFILTKVGRADRSNIDVDDIFQVISSQMHKIDWNYLKRKANQLNVHEDLFGFITRYAKLKSSFKFKKIFEE